MLTGRFFSLGPDRRFCASFGRHQAVDRSLVAVSDSTATYSMHTLCTTHGTLRATATCARNIRSPDYPCRLLYVYCCVTKKTSIVECRRSRYSDDFINTTKPKRNKNLFLYDSAKVTEKWHRSPLLLVLMACNF